MRRGSSLMPASQQTRYLANVPGRRRPEHPVETSVAFQPCCETGIRQLHLIMPEPAEKPSLHRVVAICPMYV